ncbi:MoaD/ThiS family protein [Methanoplanus limicola]|uniref:MoaD family protein n=1 Tax=Methanoplanus limicola DSM 2279 TaxID=937775 RepID=H1Z304_9EURY|nr:MoaD/ThiS family protein [Methanoplanus limicola]EHQ35544.1 hypothetical protein Metlim_1441 [Methanoplanus limicola DSM 2279]
MKVEFQAFARYKDVFGPGGEVSLPDGTTIKGALLIFAEEKKSRETLFDGDEIRDDVLIMLNRQRVDAESADGIIPEDGDKIIIYPPVSGG